MQLTFGSVCSGIEAASVAWEGFGWRAVWFAEVDKAASEVLAYRFPAVPNHGDMTLLAGMVRRREIPAPDLLVGGTPCQAFSVAGMRRGLADERGALTLSYVDLANAIDEIRAADCLPPCIIVWENVPGVLSSKDNAFGCFLAGLAGESDALQPAGRRWSNAGCVLGPERAIAWRIIDAQYVGLAQRRRRVFVVAGAGAGFDPTAILLEFDGVRRDSAPRREKGQGSAGTLAARTQGGGFPGSDEACSGYVQPVDGNNACGGAGAQSDCDERIRGSAGLAFAKDVCPTLRAGGNMTGGDRPPGTDVDTADSLLVYSPAPTWWDGRDVSQTLDAVLHKGQTMPEKNRFPAVLHPVAFGFGSKGAGLDTAEELAPTLRASGHAESHSNGGRTPAVAYEVLPFDTTQITSPGNYSSPDFGDPCHPLARGAHAPAVCVTEPVTHTLKAEGFDASEDGTGRGQPIVPCGFQASQSGVRLNDTAGTLDANYGPRRHNGVLHTLAVRRLMPVECERLQGFPDGWTNVPTGPKRKPAADGPRYKQLGNSMAVNVMRWIGARILAWLRLNGSPIGHNSSQFDEVLG